MKLWNVTVAAELAVLAETAEEAEKVALREAHDLEMFADATESDGTFPGIWSGSDYVYGGHAEDITLEEAIERFVPAEKRFDLKLKAMLAEGDS